MDFVALFFWKLENEKNNKLDMFLPTDLQRLIPLIRLQSLNFKRTAILKYLLQNMKELGGKKNTPIVSAEECFPDPSAINR